MFAVAITLVASAIVAYLAAGATAAKGEAALAANSATPSPTPEGCLQTWNAVNSPVLPRELHGVSALATDDVWIVGQQTIEHWDGAVWMTITNTAVVSDVTYEDVAAITSDNVWAVGSKTYGGAAIAHWDGSDWNTVPNPAQQGNYYLRAIATISSDDIWAVGSAGYFLSDTAMIIHWDGTGWSIVDVGGSPPEVYGLYGITALAQDDVWAVGYEAGANLADALIVHWDGTGWTVMPQTIENVMLYDVSAISSDDIWAAGTFWDGEGTLRGVICHWDGSTWTEQWGVDNVQFYGVEALAPDDAWVIGENHYGNTRVEHWDGTQWSMVDSPNPSLEEGALWDIAAVSSQDIWAVGNSTDGDPYTLVVHYSQWCPPPVVCEPGLHIIGSPNPAASMNSLAGVDALSSDDIWAVGRFLYNWSITGTVAEHWNGSSWQVVPMPYEQQDSYPYLYDVAIISQDDVWAVGQTIPLYQTITMHWDGTSWTRIPTPSPDIRNAGLYAVDGVSANDVWTVGDYQDSSNTYRGLILHWDGSSWTQTAGPPGGLGGVLAISSDNVWAVGGTTAGLNSQTLVMHWNGTTWNTVTSPSPGDGENHLNSISAVSDNDIWAVGNSYDAVAGRRPIALHWDGSSWMLQDIPFPGRIELLGIAAVGSNDVWAVGNDDYVDGVVLHWDGSSWTSLPDPITDPTAVDILNDVVAISPNEIWAVGEQYYGYWVDQTLVERYIGSCSPSPTMTATPSSTDTPTNTAIPATNTSTSTPTPTQTIAASTSTSTPLPSATATNTAMPSDTPMPATETSTATSTATVPVSTSTATSTNTNIPTKSSTAIATSTLTATTVPSSTPTACAIYFQDVPPGHTFYDQVLCLACRGIVSGYPCGGPGEPCGTSSDPYFRPGSGITRGQIAKIVAGAAGFNEAVSGQSFEDIPPGSPFYEAIERLVAHGVVAGYPCGGPGEPCGASSLPYFRPNTGATRGQIAKLVSESAGFNETVTGQAFEDISPGSTFYDYIGRLATRDVMNGYPCGGPGEPCGASSLPYFRPNDFATRGQAGKIVANTFLPACTP